MHYYYDWDPRKERSNMRKHGLSFRQAASIFRDPNQLTLYDEDHSSEDEDRWITFGLDSSGILCAVVHTFEQLEGEACQIRIISARKATTAEESQYRKMMT